MEFILGWGCFVFSVNVEVINLPLYVFLYKIYVCIYYIDLDLMAIISKLSGKYSEVEVCPRIGNNFFLLVDQHMNGNKPIKLICPLPYNIYIIFIAQCILGWRPNKVWGRAKSKKYGYGLLSAVSKTLK